VWPCADLITEKPTGGYVPADPLHEASLPWLLARYEDVRTEWMGLDITLACVEPEDARETLRDTIERDLRDLHAELTRRTHLLDGYTLADIGHDGSLLVLYPSA
jgi:hypothetical protein